MTSSIYNRYIAFIGPLRDEECAKTFIKSMFETADPETKIQNDQYLHFTCATGRYLLKFKQFFLFKFSESIFFKILNKMF